MALNLTTAQIGTPRALAYGYVRATGMRVINYTNPTTGLMIGFWLLGDGEWDGFDNLWLNPLYAGASKLVGTNYAAGTYGSASPEAPTVHFHGGTDTPHDSPITPTSSGPDQLCDSYWLSLPGVGTRLCYSGTAYYALSWQPLSWMQNPTMDNPIGDWRSMKVRIFDADGNQTSYGFTTNPVWHFVDLYLRTLILQRTEYNISLVSGPDPLPTYAKDCFDWQSMVDAAVYCSAILPNGAQRFTGSYAFAAQTTLAAMVEQVLLCCRGYQQESAGKISLKIDRARSSIFLLTSKHLVPGTFTVDDKQVHQNANMYEGDFLDLNEPVVCNITSISVTAGSPDDNAVIVTTDVNPVAQWDIIRVGGNSNPALNLSYLVYQVNDDHHILAHPVSHTGTQSGSGGTMGYSQSRFSQRAPQIVHQQHAQAITQLASGSAAQRKLPIKLDFGNATFDQVDRLLKYEIYRDLGLDQTPWVPPVTITLRAWSESVDFNWNVLKRAECGEVISLDGSVMWEYLGDYEIIERTIFPFQSDTSQSTAGTDASGNPTGSALLAPQRSADAGTIELVLRTYNPNVFFDASDPQAQSYATVPGDPLWTGPGPVNSGYTVNYTLLQASDAGTSATVTYQGLQIKPGGHPVVTYNDGTIVNLAYSTTEFLYVDDLALRGGPVPLEATTNPGILGGVLGRMFVDFITTPAHGGGGTGGGGGGGGGGGFCYEIGTLIHAHDIVMLNTEFFDRWCAKGEAYVRGPHGAERVKHMEWVAVDEMAEFSVAGEVLRCSAVSTLLNAKTVRWQHVKDMLARTPIACLDGPLTMDSATYQRRRGLVLHIELEGPSHQYLVGGIGVWTHNLTKILGD